MSIAVWPANWANANRAPVKGVTVKSFHGISTLLVWLLLTALCTPMLAAAQDTAGQVDTYLDPLAFARVNETAGDVAVTVKYQATGETRRIDGRYLLTDSAEMYVPSASAATDGPGGQAVWKACAWVQVFFSLNALSLTSRAR